MFQQIELCSKGSVKVFKVSQDEIQMESLKINFDEVIENQPRFEWVYENQLKKLRIVSLNGVEEFTGSRLGELKELVDSHLPYYNFFQQYRQISILKATSSYNIVCVVHANGKIMVAKIFIQGCDKVAAIEELHIYQLLNKHPHPNIIKLAEYFVNAGNLILVFNFLEGGTLSQYIFNNNISHDEVKKIIRKILKALIHIHSLGIIHRDIKLDNIMLNNIDDISSVKIIDFGCSVQGNQIQSSENVGTPGYIAPEIFNNNYSELCDIFSLGCLSYSLIAGKSIFGNYHSRKELLEKNRQNLQIIEIGGDALNFIQNMVCDESIRHSAENCLLHPYLHRSIPNLIFPPFKNPFQ